MAICTTAQYSAVELYHNKKEITNFFYIFLYLVLFILKILFFCCIIS